MSRSGVPPRSAASVVGIDPAPVMLRVARRLTRTRPSSAVRYLAGTAEALPLPDDSATVVWSLATVHHWRDLDAGLEEALRVLASVGSSPRHRTLRGTGSARPGQSRLDRRPGAHVCRTLPCRRLRRHHDRSPPDGPRPPRRLRPFPREPGDGLRDRHRRSRWSEASPRSSGVRRPPSGHALGDVPDRTGHRARRRDAPHSRHR